MRFLPLLLAAMSAAAQTDVEWSRLQAARTVTAQMRDGAKIRGRLSGWTADRVDVGSTPVSRENVERVTRKSRPRGALIGLLAGFAVGMPVGAAAGPYIADFGNPSAGTRIRHGIGLGAFAAAVGAGIGALTGKQVTLYRAR